MGRHEVRHNAEQSRYELLVDGQLVGVADYRADGDVWTFPHTVIVGSRRGQGLGAELVRGAPARRTSSSAPRTSSAPRPWPRRLPTITVWGKVHTSPSAR